MVDGNYLWDIGEAINFEIFVGDPNTGVGLTGQTAYLTLTIQRDSDDKYWSGVSWTAPRTELTPSEVDSVNEPGRYLYTLSSSGNAIATRYVAHANIDNAPTIQADTYEVHVSRETDVRIYEAEPV